MTRDAGKHVTDRRPVLRTPADVGQRRAERKAHTAQDGADDAMFEAQFGGVAADRILAGTIDVTEFIEGGYTAGSTGWRIDGDGSAEFNNVVVRGTVTASDITSSTISGTTITAGGGEVTLDSSGVTIAQGAASSNFLKFGSSTHSIHSPFGNGIRYWAPAHDFYDSAGGTTTDVNVHGTLDVSGAMTVDGINSTSLIYVNGTQLEFVGHAHSATTDAGGPGATNTVSSGSYTSGTTSGASAGTAHTHTYDRNHTHSVSSHTHTVSI